MISHLVFLCNSFFSSGTLIPYSLPEQYDYLSTELTPSESEPCHCCSCFKRKKRERKKFTVRRMPGKIAHLVPMQRLDSVLHRQAVKSSNLDQHSPTKVPPQIATTITSALPTKLSVEDSPLTSRPYSDSLPSQLHPSISSNSIKPSSNNPDDLLSHTRLRTMLSQFQEDLQLTPYGLDHKRSSV